MRAAQVRAVRSVHELLGEYEGAFAQLFADLQDARAAAAAQQEAYQHRRQSQPAGPPAREEQPPPLLLHAAQFQQQHIALGGEGPAGSQAAAAGPPPPLQGVHQSRAGASEILPAAVETTYLGGDGRRGGVNVSGPRLPNASSPQPGPSTELQWQGRAAAATDDSTEAAAAASAQPDSWASSPLDYASAARAAAMATPQHLHQQHPPQYTPQYTSLPGLPSSSSSPAAGGSARRRGWLGWVFGAGGQDRPPKKRVRNALI